MSKLQDILNRAKEAALIKSVGNNAFNNISSLLPKPAPYTSSIKELIKSIKGNEIDVDELNSLVKNIEDKIGLNLLNENDVEGILKLSDDVLAEFEKGIGDAKAIVDKTLNDLKNIASVDFTNLNFNVNLPKTFNEIKLSPDFLKKIEGAQNNDYFNKINKLKDDIVKSKEGFIEIIKEKDIMNIFENFIARKYQDEFNALETFEEKLQFKEDIFEYMYNPEQISQFKQQITKFNVFASTLNQNIKELNVSVTKLMVKQAIPVTIPTPTAPGIPNMARFILENAETVKLLKSTLNSSSDNLIQMMEPLSFMMIEPPKFMSDMIKNITKLNKLFNKVPM